MNYISAVIKIKKIYVHYFWEGGLKCLSNATTINLEEEKKHDFSFR